jgi:hypothetical protein
MKRRNFLQAAASVLPMSAAVLMVQRGRIAEATPMVEPVMEPVVEPCQDDYPAPYVEPEHIPNSVYDDVPAFRRLFDTVDPSLVYLIRYSWFEDRVLRTHTLSRSLECRRVGDDMHLLLRRGPPLVLTPDTGVNIDQRRRANDHAIGLSRFSRCRQFITSCCIQPESRYTTFARLCEMYRIPHKSSVHDREWCFNNLEQAQWADWFIKESELS